MTTRGCQDCLHRKFQGIHHTQLTSPRKKQTKKILLELIEFSEVISYNQSFLYNKKPCGAEIKSKILFTIALNKIKYLGINLTERVPVS